MTTPAQVGASPGQGLEDGPRRGGRRTGKGGRRRREVGHGISGRRGPRERSIPSPEGLPGGLESHPAEEAHGIPSARAHGHEGVGHQLRGLGHRRHVGSGGRRGVHEGAPRRRRRRGELHRHRRRLRRRAQRAPGGPTASRAQGRPDPRGHQGGPPAPAADPGGLQPREPQRLGEPEPEEPGDGARRSPPAPLPAPGRVRRPRGVRHPGRDGGGGEDPPLRRQRRDGGRGPAGDPAPRGPDGPDHLQHVPAQAGRAVLPRGPGPAGGDPGPRAPGQRAPHREALERLDLRRRRPPPLQPRGPGLRQGRDLLGGALRGGARGGGGAAAAGPARGRRWPSSRCAGS